MLDEATRRLNAATDGRTNRTVPLLPLDRPDAHGLQSLRAQWAALPMTPKVVLDRSAGIDNSWPGFDIRTVLSGEESAGRFTFHDVIVAPGAALPPHHLTVSDAYWCVLEGEVELTIGGRTETARQDAFAYAPNDTTQGVRNQSAAPARLFLWYSPAGPERAFATAHRLWLDRPDTPSEAILHALTPFGFVFHAADETLQNDERLNAASARLEADIRSFDDFAGLRSGWARRPPLPKIVHDRTLVADIPMKGQDTKVLLSGDECAGRSVAMHYGIEPGYVAPPHHQPTEEEIFMVLEGPLELTIGQETVMAPTGSFGFAPRYATHAFRNPSQQGDVRTVTINSPAGHERGFEMIVREGPSERLPDLLVAHGWHVHDDYQPAE